MTDLAVKLLEEIDRRLAMCRAATPGPWASSGYCGDDNSRHIGTLGPVGCTGIGIDDQHSISEVVADAWADADEGKANADFIAASRNEREGELMAQKDEVIWLDNELSSPPDIMWESTFRKRLQAIAKFLDVTN